MAHFKLHYPRYFATDGRTFVQTQLRMLQVRDLEAKIAALEIMVTALSRYIPDPDKQLRMTIMEITNTTIAEMKSANASDERCDAVREALLDIT